VFFVQASGGQTPGRRYARRFLLGARLIADGARDQEGDQRADQTHDQNDEFFSTIGLVH